MSNRAITAVLDYSKTKGSARVLEIVIADGIMKDAGYYEAAIETLVWQCNADERFVHRLINRNIELGELIVYSRPRYRNRYLIPLYEGEPGYNPQPCESTDHSCNGHHTPLWVSREDAQREEVMQRRRATRAARKSKGKPQGEGDPTVADRPPSTVADRPPIDPLVVNRPPQGGQETTPGWSIDHPNGGQETTRTLYLPNPYPNLTHDGALSIAIEETAIKSPDCDTVPMPAYWRTAQQVLRQQMSAAQYTSWIGGTSLEARTDDPRHFVVIARTKYAAEQLEARFADRVRSALCEATGGTITGLDVRARQ